MRVAVCAGFSEGHALPALALARALRERGHDVLVDLSERWRDPVLDLGLEFRTTAPYAPFPEHAPEQPSVVEAARGLADALAEFRAEVVVGDLVATAAPLAAELVNAPGATLIPTVYPVQGVGLPPFAAGFAPPRTAGAAHAWRLATRASAPLRPTSRWLRQVPASIQRTRGELGLGPLPASTVYTTYGWIEPGLALVATFPQLEYPRRWPAGAHVVGPMRLERGEGSTDVPAGDAPLVLVAGSTAQSGGRELIAAALAGLANEPVRVLASLNRRGERWDGPIPANATVIDWAGYGTVLPQAALLVSTGGLGSIATALSAGVPVVVCPVGADTAENGARLAWAGAGEMLPRRLLGPRSLRRVTRLVLTQRRYASRAREIAAWGAAHDGPRTAAALIESYSDSVSGR